MYRVPAAFAARLSRTFEGRLRLRWSSARQEYHLEQRVRRALAEGYVKDSHDDDGIRRRDGYLYLLSIRPGTSMPCPRCGIKLAVPLHEIREISCPMCKVQGHEYRIAAGFFPLNDQLLDYVKTLDPTRDASRQLRNRVDTHNMALQTRQGQAVLNATTDAANDDFRRIAGIPMTGYTGKELRG